MSLIVLLDAVSSRITKCAASCFGPARTKGLAVWTR